MPKPPKARPDALTRPALAQRLNADATPQVSAAVEALKEAALRLFNATEGGAAAALLRQIADGLDALCAEKRPPHRPKGATQYDPALLRAAMEWAEGHVIPPGSKLGRDRLLAHTLYHLQEKTHGRYGANENAIYKRILRFREEDKRARQAAVAELGADEANKLGSLATFLFRE